MIGSVSDDRAPCFCENVQPRPCPRVIASCTLPTIREQLPQQLSELVDPYCLGFK